MNLSKKREHAWFNRTCEGNIPDELSYTPGQIKAKLELTNIINNKKVYIKFKDKFYLWLENDVENLENVFLPTNVL